MYLRRRPTQAKQPQSHRWAVRLWLYQYRRRTWARRSLQHQSSLQAADRAAASNPVRARVGANRRVQARSPVQSYRAKTNESAMSMILRFCPKQSSDKQSLYKALCRDCPVSLETVSRGPPFGRVIAAIMQEDQTLNAVGRVFKERRQSRLRVQATRQRLP